MKTTQQQINETVLEVTSSLKDAMQNAQELALTNPGMYVIADVSLGFNPVVERDDGKLALMCGETAVFNLREAVVNAREFTRKIESEKTGDSRKIDLRVMRIVEWANAYCESQQKLVEAISSKYKE